MSEEKLIKNPIQGMYAAVDDQVGVRCTVTMSDVSVSVYKEVNLLPFTALQAGKAFARVAQKAGTTIDRNSFDQDMTDLILAVEKTQKTVMHLRSGNKVTTYVAKTPVQDDETGYLELAPQRKEWWMGNPHLEPIVTAINEYLPGFSPWKGQLDDYIRIFSKTSSLL